MMMLQQQQQHLLLLVLSSLIRATMGQQSQPQSRCTLCYDGSEPALMDSTTELMEDLTCEGLMTLAEQAIPDSVQCKFHQETALLCGCPVPPERCSLCHDGSLPPRDMWDFFIEPYDLTCAEAYFAAGTSNRTADDPTSCDFWPPLGVICGCPIPPGGCPLCADQSLPPDLSFLPQLFGTNESCADLVALAAAPQPPNVEPIPCDAWLGIGLACQCPIPTDTCTLCEDGTNVTSLASSRQDGAPSIQYCSFIQDRILLASPNQCRDFQATIGVYCGCANPIASDGYCRICGENRLLPNFTHVAYVNEAGEKVACGDVELNLNGTDCLVLQEQYAPICCVPAIPSSVPSPLTPPTANTVPTSGAACSLGAWTRDGIIIRVICSALMWMGGLFVI